VHRPRTHFDPQLVHQPKGSDKQAAAGHNFIKVISVGNQQSFVNSMGRFKNDLTETLWHITIVMITAHPDHLLAV